MHRSQRRLEASHFLIYPLMEKIDISWKIIDFLCCNLWEPEKLKVIFCSILRLLKKKNFREVCLNYFLDLTIQIHLLLFRLVLLNKKHLEVVPLLSILLLNCLNVQPTSTEWPTNCKNISLTVIKKQHLTLLVGKKSMRKTTDFPWYAHSANFKAFCLPFISLFP